MGNNTALAVAGKRLESSARPSLGGRGSRATHRLERSRLLVLSVDLRRLKTAEPFCVLPTVLNGSAAQSCLKTRLRTESVAPRTSHGRSGASPYHESTPRISHYSDTPELRRSGAASVLRTGVKATLSRRDYRTKPGGLTPGIRPEMIRLPVRRSFGNAGRMRKGAADTWYQRPVCLTSYVSEESIRAPGQSGVLFLLTPGVKTPGLVLQSLRDKSSQLSTNSTPHHCVHPETRNLSPITFRLSPFSI